MSNLLTELNETIRILENRIPANPASEKNEKLERALQRDLADYFKKLDQAIDWDRLEQLYYKHVGIAESDRPAKPIIEEPLVEVLEPIVIQGEKGEPGLDGKDGKHGERGERGLDGKNGRDGKDGKDGSDGKRGERGERGEKGLDGKQGERGEQGENGNKGDPGLTKKQQDDIKKVIKDFSNKKFIEDDDPRLKDERSPKSHKHPEIQPLNIAYPVMNVAGLSGGIQSEPPEGYLEVTNVYFDPETHNMVVVYKGE